MGLWVGGPANSQAEVDGYWKSVRGTVRSIDYVGPGRIAPNKIYGGHYRASINANHTAAFAANSVVFTFRWVQPHMNAVVWYVKFGFFAGVIATAPIVTLDYGLYFARGYTANFSTNGTALTYALNGYKKRVSMAETGLAAGECRYATNNPCTGGTATIDSQPLAYIGTYAAVASPSGATTNDIYATNMETEQEAPIVLGLNEGLQIRNITAYANAPTIKFWVEMAWSEVPFGLF